MKPAITYILVADGSRARVLVNSGPGRGLLQLPDSDFRHEIPPERELHRDKPSRVQQSASPARHAAERPSLHERAKALFARWLVAFLDKSFSAKHFNRLIIVAPPEMLANLRASIKGPLSAAVVAELAKDLTSLPNNDVYDHLQKSLNIPI